MKSPLPEQVLKQAFHEARTFNSYTDRPVEEATLVRLYDLYSWGPTSTNQQPLRVIWCTTKDSKDRLSGHCFEGNAKKVREAPVTAILGMELDFVRTLKRLFPIADATSWYGDDERFLADSALRNSSLQGAYLIIAARMLGLDAGPLGGFDADAIDKDFFASSTIRVNFLVTLGYGDPSTLYPPWPAARLHGGHHGRLSDDALGDRSMAGMVLHDHPDRDGTRAGWPGCAAA